MNQLISNVLMQPKPDAVERPLTLVEKLGQKRDHHNHFLETCSNDRDKAYHSFGKKCYQEAIDIVKQHSDWVSVDERLPSVNLKVLVWHSRKEKFFTATYDRDLKIWLENGSPYLSNFLYSITHWQPLPQPPSEVQDD